ncbi:MAG: sulfatase [Opitutia bacterium Tous-C1TDCM]|nr:MAG: sulfatase [Opitutae bacterium Tous-C1TDCM]
MLPGNPPDALCRQTRRHFFSRCGLGLGGIALASMLGKSPLRAAAAAAAPLANPLAPKPPQFAPKAKNVIFLFMAGGPSQLELFDYKPKLLELNGQPVPESLIAGKRFAFMDSSHGTKLLGTRREFKRHGRSGAWVSDLFPHTARIVDDISIVKSCQATLFNHAPAKLFMNTGSGQFGRPSMGSWVNYGLGSECQDLPGFVVLQSGPRGPRGGAVNWGSGFLPTTYQGVPLRGGGDPILNLSNPAGITTERQRQTVDAIRDLNLKRAVATGDAEIQTRIAAYEMACRMQASAPDLIDLSKESEATLNLYGVEKSTPSFGRNCLLARRLVERGVRFVQLYHTNWDSHGGPGENLQGDFEKVCREVDQGQAALVQDLKDRGLLKDTLVVWGGEFGRTPMGENRDTTGRNHHIDAFTMWFAGGGTKAGVTIGETDELGFNAVADPFHVHDIHATLLHALGIEHTNLTFRFQGRDFRLTDVHGHVLHKLFA